jgi:hypothetical protein
MPEERHHLEVKTASAASHPRRKYTEKTPYRGPGCREIPDSSSETVCIISGVVNERTEKIAPTMKRVLKRR